MLVLFSAGIFQHRSLSVSYRNVLIGDWETIPMKWILYIYIFIWRNQNIYLFCRRCYANNWKSRTWMLNIYFLACQWFCNWINKTDPLLLLLLRISQTMDRLISWSIFFGRSSNVLNNVNRYTIEFRWMKKKQHIFSNWNRAGKLRCDLFWQAEK